MGHGLVCCAAQVCLLFSLLICYLEVVHMPAPPVSQTQPHHGSSLLHPCGSSGISLTMLLRFNKLELLCVLI